MANTNYKQPTSVKITAFTEDTTNHGDLSTLSISVGNRRKNPDGEAIETKGIKIRGTGAATKGTMARGPMG